MQGLTGLTALAGYNVQIDTESQASPEDRSGSPANPRHGEWANIEPAYLSKITPGGSHGPYGPENQMLGEFDSFVLTPAGNETQDPYMDRTPSRRAGPFPKGIASGPVPGETPDHVAFQRQQSMAIHGIRTNAAIRSGFSPLGDVRNDEWESFYEVDPGHTDLVPIPRQSMSSGFVFGTRDRTQSFARQNEHGFDSAHKSRRFATGSIPGNYMWMKPGGRPLVKSLPGPARPAIGPSSPFYGQDLGQAFSIDGAMLQNVPPEYEPPPGPNLAPSQNSPDYGESVVEWY